MGECEQHVRLENTCAHIPLPPPPALRPLRRSETQERGAQASPAPIQTAASTTLGPSARSGEGQTGSSAELRPPLAIVTCFLAQPLGHVRPAQRGG